MIGHDVNEKDLRPRELSILILVDTRESVVPATFDRSSPAMTKERRPSNAVPSESSQSSASRVGVFLVVGLLPDIC